MTPTHCNLKQTIVEVLLWSQKIPYIALVKAIKLSVKIDINERIFSEAVDLSTT